MAIQIDNLYKKFPNSEVAAIDQLSLNIKKGIITGFLGPNSAGKTTTLSILFGLVKQDSGTAQILGLDNIKDTNIIKQKVGIVPQKIALFPNLTGRENLMYLGSLYNIPKQELTKKVNQYIDEFALTPHADKKVDKYSGGMKRRANIIAGLLHDPEILILDEPTAGVDIHSRALILDFLKNYNKQGKTIIYTSHLLDEAEKLCDDIIIIDHGKKIIQGSIKELLATDNQCKNLEDLFLYHTGRVIRS